jgi:mannosyltransferase
MSQGAESAALPSRPAVRPRAESSAPRRGTLPAWLPLIPAVLTLGITLYQIQGPSFTEDEDATLLAVHRSFPQLVSLLGKVDVVHGAYYSLIWVVTHLFGGSEFAVRFPSAVAMAVAAGGVAILGRRLVSDLAGLASGLVFAVLPSVSWYAEDARDYAIVTALAVVASYLLIRAMDSPERRRRWLVWYAVALVFLGLGNLFALLLVPAHALTLASRARGDRAFGRSFVKGWLVSVAAAVVVLSPVIVAGYGQLHLVKWIEPLKLRDVLSVMRLAGTRPLFGVAAGITVIGVIAAAVAGRDRLRAAWPAPLAALALPWLLLPPVVLLTVSVAHPIYTYRYIAFCIPAIALLAGTALAALDRVLGSAGRVLGVAGLIVIALVGLSAQTSQRKQNGHGFNIRLVNQIVARHERPGDPVLLISGAVYERGLTIAYPYGLRPLRDVGQGLSPVQSTTMGGTYAPVPVQRQRLSQVSNRLWVVGGTNKTVPILNGLGFTLVRRWYVTGVYIRLYERHPSASPGPGQQQ